MQMTAGRNTKSYERGIDMQIMRLRRKIEPDPKQPRMIVTVAGGGYKFAGTVTDAESESRKLVAILAADVAGFSRLVGADEDRTLARLRALRSDLIDPTVAVHRGRVVKRTGDGESSNSAAWSTRRAVRSKCRTVWSCEIEDCRRNSASSFESASISATS